MEFSGEFLSFLQIHHLLLQVAFVADQDDGRVNHVVVIQVGHCLAIPELGCLLKRLKVRHIIHNDDATDIVIKVLGNGGIPFLLCGKNGTVKAA